MAAPDSPPQAERMTDVAPHPDPAFVAADVPELHPSTIVVAADGSEDALRAVHWAAEQAFLERCPLVVVTAVGAPDVHGLTWTALGSGYARHPQESMEAGEAVAAEAVALARHLNEGMDVSSVVLVGDPRQVLVDLSRRVRMIVLGSRGRGIVRSKVLGSVSAAVSRDAACPVMVCRPTRPDRTAGKGVLVGADGTPESVPVLDLAFAEASVRNLPLTVVHCVWDVDRPRHDAELVPADEPGMEADRLLLAESVAGLTAKFPEVAVDLRIAQGIAEEFLSGPGADWDLVVVGRHPVDSLMRLLTGAIATFVVERAATTVVVVPQSEPMESRVR